MNIEVNDKSFEIIKLLGKGKGGYSYLVSDGSRNYVVKKIHHEPCSYYQFGNKLESEMNDYKRLISIGIELPELFEVDEQREHILKEYIDGDTIYDMVKEKKDVNTYISQLKEMCKSLYASNTNIDYFPTNFVPQNGILYYIDYECNDYMEEWNFENWGIKYWSQTREFIGYVNSETVKSFFVVGYNKHNYEKVMKLLDENYVDHSPANARGNAGAVNILKCCEDLFTDINVDILDIFQENDMVGTRVKYTVTIAGEYMGVNVPGKQICFEALEHFKLNGFRITESWGYWPDMQILQQLKC